MQIEYSAADTKCAQTNMCTCSVRVTADCLRETASRKIFHVKLLKTSCETKRNQTAPNALQIKVEELPTLIGTV